MHANLVLSTFAEVQGAGFYQHLICVGLQFLTYSCFYSPVPMTVACVLKFPQTVNVSVKSNAAGLPARLNNARRNIQHFSMILLFACAHFIEL